MLTSPLSSSSSVVFWSASSSSLHTALSSVLLHPPSYYHVYIACMMMDDDDDFDFDHVSSSLSVNNTLSFNKSHQIQHVIKHREEGRETQSRRKCQLRHNLPRSFRLSCVVFTYSHLTTSLLHRHTQHRAIAFLQDGLLCRRRPGAPSGYPPESPESSPSIYSSCQCFHDASYTNKVCNYICCVN